MSAQICYATDLSPESEHAFAYAVALAARKKAPLLTLHASDTATPNMLPEANGLLQQWNWTQRVQNSRKVHSCCEDPVDTLLDALSREDVELLVVGTHQRQGLSRLAQGSVSESVALSSGLPTLFVPTQAKGFVEPATGTLRLKRVLIPCSRDAALNQLAVDKTAALIGALTEQHQVEVHLLSVGTSPATVELPDLPGVKWTQDRMEGKVVEAIVGMAARLKVDLVVMGTEGQDSLRDVLTGSKTHQVMRNLRQPLLALPAKA
ncbi:MAG: universal stress protein [Myxococcota bacterium]|nr:universal stress protein [Myxococcota bacterium]